MIESGPFAGHYAHHYGCVLADPPWRFKTYDGKKAVPGVKGVDPYKTMAIDEIAAIPLPQVAATDCALFLWYPGSMADQAFGMVQAAWGFRFIRSEVFIWVKDREVAQPKIGPGYWSRNGAECCALFTRGSPRVWDHGVEQVIFCARGGHSSKPEQAHERVEALTGGPYLEMFARRTRPGWASWGDQVGLLDGSLI